MERVTELINFANEQIAKWCPEYHLKLLRSKNKAGHCRYITKEIGISKWHMENTPIEDVKNTVLHEIAHALAGPKAKHGWMWKQKCLLVGAKPERCHQLDVGHVYEIHCKCTDTIRKFQKKPNPAVWERKRCRTCRVGGKDWVYKETASGEVVELEARPVPVRRARRRLRYGGFRF
jgi:predicted SprT family Zn-dependent metalloprotease